MPEVTTEDSISRRGSYSSPQNNNNNNYHPRATSHTQHAAAVAAAHPGNTASISGPRPPPRTVKEARPWAFTNFDNRTKTELAASVDQASYASDMRTRVAGPRGLADSDIALRRGVLPPPVCSDPKVQRVPDRSLQKRTGTASQEGSRDGSSGAWGKDWSALKAETGYVTPANSTDVTPMSTPRVPLGVPLFSSRIASRALSPVVEVDDKRSSGGSAGNTTRPATAPAPAPAPAHPAPSRHARTTSQYSAPPSTTPTMSTAARAHAPLSGPRSHSYTQPPVTTTARYGSTLRYDNTGTLLRPPPPTVTTVSPTTSTPSTRVRLVRAQDSSSARPPPQDRPRYETASLRRPPRLTSELRTPEDDRLFFVNPPPPPASSNNQGRPDLVRMPGSWE